MINIRVNAFHTTSQSVILFQPLRELPHHWDNNVGGCPPVGIRVGRLRVPAGSLRIGHGEARLARLYSDTCSGRLVARLSADDTRRDVASDCGDRAMRWCTPRVWPESATLELWLVISLCLRPTWWVRHLHRKILCRKRRVCFICILLFPHAVSVVIYCPDSWNGRIFACYSPRCINNFQTS